MKRAKVAKVTTQAVQVKGSADSQEIDISSRIAKASAYLNSTQSEFVANATKARDLLNGSEGGVLAGPVVRR